MSPKRARMPSLFKGMRNGRSLKGGWGEESLPHPFVVAIAIIAPDGSTKAVRDSLDSPLFGGEIKAPGGSDHDSPHMRAPTGHRLWHHRPHQITRLIPIVAPAPLAMADGKAQVVRVTHLAPTMSLCQNPPGKHLCCL